MKGRKIVTVLIIINLILVGIIYNLINKENVNNKKQIIKEMTETEYEDYITELNQSHEDYANYIEESKKKIASAITEMGVTTSNEETLETMASNIRNIPKNKYISVNNNFTSVYSDKTVHQTSYVIPKDVDCGLLMLSDASEYHMPEHGETLISSLTSGSYKYIGTAPDGGTGHKNFVYVINDVKADTTITLTRDTVWSGINVIQIN